jgi:hypothetical protein
VEKVGADNNSKAAISKGRPIKHDRNKKGKMLETMNYDGLTRHLMGIANDSTLRQNVYDQMGEYCHQCRNRLNSMKLCLYLAKRQSHPTTQADLAILEQLYATLERSIDLIQTLCRPMPVSMSSLGLDLLIREHEPDWARMATDRDIELEFIPPTARAVAQFDPDRMGQALDVLVEWRLARMAAGGEARMSWRVEGAEARLTWEEEATSYSVDSSESLGVHAWALPLITRVAEAHGGGIRTQSGDVWRLDLNWPISPDVSKTRPATKIARLSDHPPLPRIDRRSPLP